MKSRRRSMSTEPGLTSPQERARVFTEPCLLSYAGQPQPALSLFPLALGTESLAQSGRRQTCCLPDAALMDVHVPGQGLRFSPGSWDSHLCAADLCTRRGEWQEIGSTCVANAHQCRCGRITVNSRNSLPVHKGTTGLRHIPGMDLWPLGRTG